MIIAENRVQKLLFFFVEIFDHSIVTKTLIDSRKE